MTIGRVVDIEEAACLSRSLREAGRTVVLTNGHFDVLHLGHALYLQGARELGEALFVGVNDDAATTALKGPQRPLVPAPERAALLTHLRSVDYAVIFEGLTAHELVRRLRPHYYVKGGDYRLDTLPEATAAAEVGAEVRFLPLAAGLSTSNLVRRILDRYRP